MPVAQELVQVVEELLRRAAPVQREAAAQPAEGPQRVVLEQRAEARRDVDHRRLREGRERLVRGLHREVRAAQLVHRVVARGRAVGKLGRVERMERQVGRPGLVRVEEHAALLAEAGDLPGRIEHALVGAGREDEQARRAGGAGGARELRLDVGEGDGTPDAVAGVVAGGQVARDGARHHDGVVDGLVAVAVEEDDLAGAQQRHQHRLVRRARAVRDEAGRGAAEDLGGEALRVDERRGALGRGEVAEALDRDREVRAEGHLAEVVVEAAQEG